MAVSDQQERSEIMSILSKQKSAIINIVSILLFVAGLLSTVIIFWVSLGKNLLNPSGQVALTFELPVIYYVLSCFFAVLLLALVVFAYVYKKKLLVLMPLIYEILVILSAVTFALISSNMGASAYVFAIILFSLIAPLYGFCYVSYIWCLFLIIPLLFATFIITFKLFKKDKDVFKGKKGRAVKK